MSQKEDERCLKLLNEKHLSYIKSLRSEEKSFEGLSSEQLRVSGFYWGLAALDVLKFAEQQSKEEIESIINFVLACQTREGGFGGYIGHDPHLLYTLSALQVLAIFGCLERANLDAVVKYVSSLQNRTDGSFSGDKWGEVDTRFSYIGISCLALLHRLDAIDVDLAVKFILKCQNFDHAFGCVPGAESHAGQTFCCVGALSIVNRLDLLDRDGLAWWLCERQTEVGGLNGRPEKLPDVCYSWWVLSCLSILGRLDWLDKDKLIWWILQCQDPENGGIADRPGDRVDVYHTFFGVGGLSLLSYEGLEPIDPSFALTRKLVQNLSLSPQTLAP
eukprot:TRINITY_DN3811_c0_g1_i1.p1 TRINITY_DN3811_c0_g1~~TRINITY_DN3811_c0_g1_i1.p1  ORF type:complete len:351 (+),score=75.01 TRINITY_DN3811_c0_g1_i1:62-1054(+)